MDVSTCTVTPTVHCNHLRLSSPVLSGAGLAWLCSSQRSVAKRSTETAQPPVCHDTGRGQKGWVILQPDVPPGTCNPSWDIVFSADWIGGRNPAPFYLCHLQRE